MAGSTQSDSSALTEHLEAASRTPQRYLSENDIDDIEAVFDDADVNGDGLVTRAELEETLAKFSLPDEEAAAIKEALAGESGVSLEQVQVIRAQAKLRARAQTVKRSFDAADSDANGSIDVDELAKFMAETGAGDVQAERDRLLVALDLDGNREISFDEFLSYDLSIQYPSRA